MDGWIAWWVSLRYYVLLHCCSTGLWVSGLVRCCGVFLWCVHGFVGYRFLFLFFSRPTGPALAYLSVPPAHINTRIQTVYEQQLFFVSPMHVCLSGVSSPTTTHFRPSRVLLMYQVVMWSTTWFSRFPIRENARYLRPERYISFRTAPSLFGTNNLELVWNTFSSIVSKKGLSRIPTAVPVDYET